MDPIAKVLAAIVAGAVSLVVGAAGGWYARGVSDDRARLQADLDQQRGARILEAQDRRTATAAAADYQQQLATIRAALAATSQEAEHALRKPIQCPPGASGVALGDVPVPAVLVDRLRSAVASGEGDRPPTR